MSNERNGIRFRTGANDNLLSILGDLVSSDGVRAFRVPLGTPGQFLSVDLTAECGVSWQTPSGNLLTFSDGVTKTIANVTNDLVTGTTVDSVDAIANAGDIDLTTVGAFDINLTSGLAITALATGAFRLESSAASGNVQTLDNLDLKTFGGNGSINLSTTGTGDINVAPNHDEVHTVGRNFTLTAAGSTGIIIDSTVGNTVINAGSVDDSGEVRIMPTVAAPSATRKLRFWNGVGAGQVTIADAAGGVVQDAEVRAVVTSVLTALTGWGLRA